MSTYRRQDHWKPVAPTITRDWREYANKPDERRKLQHNDPVLDRFAEEVEDRYGLPPGVLVAIKNAGEMTQNNGGDWGVSGKGAKGVMQFMPASVSAFPHDPSDPFANIDAAGKIMADKLKSSKGNVWAAVAMYNGGTAARRAVERGEPPPAEETRNYLGYVKDYMTNFYRDRLGARIQERQQRREGSNDNQE